MSLLEPEEHTQVRNREMHIAGSPGELNIAGAVMAFIEMQKDHVLTNLVDGDICVAVGFVPLATIHVSLVACRGPDTARICY